MEEYVYTFKSSSLDVVVVVASEDDARSQFVHLLLVVFGKCFARTLIHNIRAHTHAFAKTRSL